MADDDVSVPMGVGNLAHVDYVQKALEAGTCPFLHDNIKYLYGVDLTPVEDLPKQCTCGQVLTYADPVVFVQPLVQRPTALDLHGYTVRRMDKSFCPDCKAPVLWLHAKIEEGADEATLRRVSALPSFYLWGCGFIGEVGVGPVARGGAG